MLWRDKLDERLKAIEARLRSDETEKQIKSLTDLLGEAKQIISQAMNVADCFAGKVHDGELMLIEYEKTCERIATQTIVSNDAQANRYFELKRRVDTFENTFRQLGILISKQNLTEV